MEIVSEPDLRTPEEAGAYLRKLRAIVRYLDISDGNLEEGSFRCDANISLRRWGDDGFGTRAELKNLNSFKHVEKALQYEIFRQAETIRDGGDITQETRLWDPAKNRSTAMRGKEEAHDYRYFPDPDLLPLAIAPEWVAAIQNDLPELPDAKAKRFIETYGLPPYNAAFLTAGRELGNFFEDCVKAYDAPKLISNWIMGPLLGRLNAEEKDIATSPVAPGALARLIKLIDTDVISGKIAKTVFEEMAATGGDPENIVTARGLAQVSDTITIEGVVEDILSAHPDEVTAYQNGKKKLLGFFVGQVMQITKGRANPNRVNRILKEKLGG